MLNVLTVAHRQRLCIQTATRCYRRIIELQRCASQLTIVLQEKQVFSILRQVLLV